MARLSSFVTTSKATVRNTDAATGAKSADSGIFRILLLFQVASTLRQELAGPLVIIAITGYGQEEDRRQALTAGCDYHFLKPVDPYALTTLLSALERGEGRIQDGPPSEAMVHEERPVLTVTRQVEIVNALGFHLRAADKFVRLAQGFKANVTVICGGHRVSGRSILDLATLAAAFGSRLELQANGPDAEAALDALTGLIGRRFDEQE
jgi:phosphocarrier protein HPr